MGTICPGIAKISAIMPQEKAGSRVVTEFERYSHYNIYIHDTRFNPAALSGNCNTLKHTCVSLISMGQCFKCRPERREVVYALTSH